MPLTRLITGHPYAHTFFANDVDRDVLTYSLVSGPLGLTLENKSSIYRGITWANINWTPTVLDLGSHPVVVRVEDIHGDSNLQKFTLEVELNLPPQFTSQPVTSAIVGHSYYYAYSAVDANDDSIYYTLLSAPEGMVLKQIYGKSLSWKPGTIQAGVHNIVLQADDGFGGITTQEFVIYVAANQPPVITQQPSQNAITGFQYSELFQATDPDGDSITYNLISGPQGMQLLYDYLGRIISWKPTEEQLGVHKVVVEARDSYNAWVTYSYDIRVEQNQPPVITTVPVTTGITSHKYGYVPKATDPETGADVPFSFVSGPAGMVMSYGQVLWTPTELQSGNHPVVIQANDYNGGSTQQSFTIAVSKNALPVITSQPVKGAKVDATYRYDLTATDADGDGVYFELVSGPANLGITNHKIVFWTPTVDQIGKHLVSLNAVDAVNGKTNQTFEITVIDTALAFTSYPNNPTIFNDELYNFTLEALHPNDAPLSYALTLAPAGLTIDALGGVISWMPTLAQIGTHSITATVSDGIDQTDTVTFTIQVTENTNQAPVIDSLPVTSAIIDTQYAYAVSASDAENHAISYSLTQAPAGMVVNASGLISWIPAAADVGDYPVTVRATDERGRFSEQSYALTVQPANQKPVVNGIPATSAAVGYEYHQVLPVTDPDGDALNFAVLDAPIGVSIDSVSGRVSWIPTADQVGSHLLTIQVDDGEAFIAVYWTVAVSDTLLPIDLFVSLEPRVIQLGEVTTLSVITNGGIAETEATVMVDGLLVTLDTHGQAILHGDIIGRHDVEVTVTDGINNEAYTTYYSVADPTDVTPPVVEIISPLSGATITAPTDIIGIVQDDNIAEVLLAYRKPEDTEDIVLYKGSDLFVNQAIASFDPTQLVNGMYYIILQATDINGQTTTTAKVVVVEGDLKVGNFSITLEDLNIPLAGIPISVSRTYDSRRRNENLDFGYGWSIDYQNVRLQESDEPTKGWTQTISKNELFKASGGYLSSNAVCINPSYEKSVTVTLPNGDTEKFIVVAKPTNGTEPSVTNPNCYLTTDRTYNMFFVATGGTTSTLETSDGDSLYLADLENGYLAPIGDAFAWPITNYTLTTREGYVYHLNQDFGVTQIVDPNGNTLTYNDTGITHSSGKSISFNRDVNGRINSISDATGTLYSYSYNSLGELSASTDALTHATTYSYTQGHALEDILDPLLRRLVRNIYDLDGRLIAQEDSDGVRTNFNHDVAGRVSIVTNRRGYSTQYTYDDHGNVLSETDALLNTTTYTYDADDNQLSKTNALGKTSNATYNAEGDQLTQTDELQNTTTFTYNSRGQELTVTDAKGNTFTNEYDLQANLISITDPAGNTASNTILQLDFGLPKTVTNTLGYTTSYTYDGYGYKVTETDALGNVITYVNDDDGNVLSDTRSRTINGLLVDETTTYTYDELNRLLSTTNALQQTTSQEYDAVGNKVRDIDAEGRITEYTYDAYNRLTRTDYPYTSFSASTYDAEGNKLSDTDRIGYVTTYVYDELNRLVTTTYDDGTSTHIEYDKVGRVTAEIDANNNRTEFNYDDAGRRTLTRDALLKETSFTYDKEGNLKTQTDANIYTTTFEYDKLDNRVKTIYPDLSESTQAYDAMGQVTSRTDQKLKTTGYVYDKFGRLTQVTDALLGLTKYTYDEVGNKLTQTDAESDGVSRTTSWAYDALSRETSRTLPLGQSDSSSYDVHGNLQSHTDFNGQVTGYLYDSNNRVERIDYDGLTAESFGYDNEGRRTSATDRQGQIQSWVYDNRGRLTQDNKANGDQLDYGYDNTGNRVALTITPNGGTAQTTGYTFDGLNRLATVTDSNNQVTTYGYDYVGNRDSVAYPNGNVTNYAYDNLNRLTQQTSTAGINILTDFQYTLDDSGHRTKITEASGRVTDYTYDDLYRLLTENITDAVNGNYSASYQYDKVGNRTYSTINGVQTLFSYDDNDRLTQQGGTTYTYDYNGNTLTETLDLNTTSYTYDAKNEMVGSDNGVVSSYGYDIDGIREQKVVGGETISYLTDANRAYAQVIKETNTTTGNITDYLYGDDLIRQSKAANDSYYLYDGLGSTRALTNSAGAITDTYNYESFGEVLNHTGTTPNNYLFTGEQFDSNLDNYYLRARYYNQKAGRFTQMDTWAGDSQDPVTLHKYLYANVDPANNIDPSGNFSLSSVGASINIIGTLVTRAQFAYDVFKIATGEEEFSASSAGSALLFRMLPIKTAARLLNKVRRKKSRGAPIEDCNSFIGETIVHTNSGKSYIENIEIGDIVISYNEITNAIDYQEVTHLIQHDKNDKLVVIELSDNSVIYATLIHPFYVDGKWLDAKDLKPDDKLKLIKGELYVTNVKITASGKKVYNLTVGNTHTYFVGEQGVLVHNKNISCDILLRNSNLSGVPKNKWAKSKQGVSGPGVRDHFDKHGRQVGARSVKEYDLSARLTIKNGKSFNYRDPTTNEARVGYWDVTTGFFTATSPSGKTAILTHFPVSWKKIKSWPGFSN